jgi:hypothetical protein
MPLVLASVDIKVKTVPDHRLSVIIRDVGKLVTLDSHHQGTGDGEVAISSFVSKSEVDIQVILRSIDVHGKFIDMIKEKFEGVPTGEVINIKLIPGETAEIVSSFDEPEEEVEELVQESPEEEVVEEKIEESDITGEATKNLGDFNSKVVYYVIGVALLLLIGFYLVKNRKKMGKSGFKVVKFSDDDDKDEYEKRVKVAEMKLKEAQEALSKLS